MISFYTIEIVSVCPELANGKNIVIVIVFVYLILFPIPFVYESIKIVNIISLLITVS